jgi:hypothetical protein
MDILKGIRPVDYVLAAVMVALAALLGVANVTMDPTPDSRTRSTRSRAADPGLHGGGPAGPVAPPQHPRRDRRLVRVVAASVPAFGG